VAGRRQRVVAAAQTPHQIEAPQRHDEREQLVVHRGGVFRLGQDLLGFLEAPELVQSLAEQQARFAGGGAFERGSGKALHVGKVVSIARQTGGLQKKLGIT
jgi:hypothetical protein